MPIELHSILWEEDGTVRVLDQTLLPHREAWRTCRTPQEVAECISRLCVRGAPAIGIAAAYAMALAAQSGGCRDTQELLGRLEETAAMLRATRPTAVNLSWAVERMLARARGLRALDPEEAAALLIREARAIAAEDEAANRRLARFGQALLPQAGSVLTHCNAGALATGGYGTALGVIRAAWEEGKTIHVYVDETRPVLQGARITAWELQRLGIPFTLITDNMAGHFMRLGRIDAVVVGADRIAANGDLANKIGTYSLAVLAFAHGIPFYSAAPTSTLDLSLADGNQIPIEERDPEEVTHLAGRRVAPRGVRAANPAFDLTPHRYVTAIITERGIARPPYEESLKKLLEKPS
ncbi:MAG: S-methyl-5-thioribose-1-phosphate isomerase [Chloroflexia bacterium]